MIQVYLIKRSLRQRSRNGRPKHRWVLRWQDPVSGRWECETTGTADRTGAEAMQAAKRAELNMPRRHAAEPTPAIDVQVAPAATAEPPAPPTWERCREALQRAMTADNMRPSYVNDALLNLELLRRTFPDVASPAGITSDMANEYKRQRSEVGISSWSAKGDLATLKAVFGKWLGRECRLLDPATNPFTAVTPPRCDDPEIRIVSPQESAALFAWFNEQWNDWRLPATYLKVAALLGWRATETASIREGDLLSGGHVRVLSGASKSRKHKYGWLPPELYYELQSCGAGGYAFGRFSDELRRLHLLWKKAPHHAAMVREFRPCRLVAWLQDELQRFNDDQEATVKAAREAGATVADWVRFTLHDFRRTAITGMQMAGVPEKEAGITAGVTADVMRKFYAKLDEMAIAKRTVEQRLAAEAGVIPFQPHQSLRAGCAQAQKGTVDDRRNLSQTSGA